MRKIFWLGYHTAIEILRQRILYTAILFGLLLIAVGSALDTAAPGQSGMVVLDVGLGAINLFGVLIAIVMGVNLLFQELDRKTVYTLLAKPISRTQFVFGKYLGLFGAILAVLGAMLFFFYLAILWAEAIFPSLAWMALWTIVLELALVSAIAMVFSAFSTPYLSGLFTLGIWAVGCLSNEIRNYQAIKKIQAYEGFIEVLFYFIPNFSSLNLKDRVPYNLPPPPEFLWQATLYAALYSAALLMLAVFVFQRRDFK
ncbi:MAG: ABC transporter permease [Bdellovibrionota bacterium]